MWICMWCVYVFVCVRIMDVRCVCVRLWVIPEVVGIRTCTYICTICVYVCAQIYMYVYVYVCVCTLLGVQVHTTDVITQYKKTSWF